MNKLGLRSEVLRTANWSMDAAPRNEKERRFFTVDQANRSLVLLQRIVGEITEEYEKLLDLEDMIESAERSGTPGQLERARQQLVDTVDTLQTCLEELDQIGVELRDFSRGIIDFPCLHKGQRISLCWLLGEMKVSHWHEPQAAFATRQPISLLNRQEQCLYEKLA